MIRTVFLKSERLTKDGIILELSSSKNEQIKEVLERLRIPHKLVQNKIKIENGYVTSFKGEVQLNVGKFGTMTVE